MRHKGITGFFEASKPYHPIFPLAFQLPDSLALILKIKKYREKTLAYLNPRTYLFALRKPK
jgi:hypothetical protein